MFDNFKMASVCIVVLMHVYNLILERNVISLGMVVGCTSFTSQLNSNMFEPDMCMSEMYCL